MNTNEHIWDIFISHASEDKIEIVRPLSNLLAHSGLKVWLDEGELKIGDSLREKIDEGLTKSQFAVIIFSHNFFSKNWPKSELNALFTRDINEGKVIIPIWHKLTLKEMMQYSLLLSDRYSINTDKGLISVRDEIISCIKEAGKDRKLGQPIYAGKLIKKKLLNFPVGSVLLMNTYSPPDFTPILVESLGDDTSREEFWQKMKTKGLLGTKCYVFSNLRNYWAHINSRNIWDIN